jgi:putative NADPH-quinone reductase
MQYYEFNFIIIIAFPIWWTGLPAMIKGYVDRVFSYGFAYTFNEQGGIDKLLTGKKGLLINTFGTAQHFYESIGMIGSLKKNQFPIDRVIRITLKPLLRSERFFFKGKMIFPPLYHQITYHLRRFASITIDISVFHIF